MLEKIGVLLVNLGTPDSPSLKDVKKYLVEFLTDPRVIDLPYLKQQFLVRGIIIPRRYKNSAASYKAIWQEGGSPLLAYGKAVVEKLNEVLPDNYSVQLAMRYQNPSITEGLQRLLEKNIDHLIILPLFPQYASATTGSIFEKVMNEIKKEESFPKMTFIRSFHDHPQMIDAFVQNGKAANWKDYDHILFSFHGLPERQLIKADRSGCCRKTKDCCEKYTEKNKGCYGAQSYGTAHAIIAKLGIPKDRYTICFQSRLGSDPWMQPYVSDVIKDLAGKKCKKILAFCPSFVCDCLETLYEFEEEYRTEFQHLGGETLDLVPGLNESSLWIDALKSMIQGSVNQESRTSSIEGSLVKKDLISPLI